MATAKELFEIEKKETGVTITMYTGTDMVVEVPSSIDGVAVTAIGDWAFNGCTSLS